MTVDAAEVPLAVRLRFGRAAVQTVADRLGADILHIKGGAVDASLRADADSGSDVDILVRPLHVAALDRILRANGWRLYTSFVSGSPFGHAQTYRHDAWGYLDLHRSFPGFRAPPGAVFARLWTDRTHVDSAGITCSVPSVAAQATILVLNAARARGSGATEVADVWHAAPEEQRALIEALVDELDAHVAFAAATGDLERYRGERDYPLWRTISTGGSRSAEWWARIRAAEHPLEALRIAMRAPLVNIEQLTLTLGREPTNREITQAFFGRPLRAAAEGWRSLRSSKAAR